MKLLKNPMIVYQIEEDMSIKRLYSPEIKQMDDLIGTNFEVQMNNNSNYYVINCTKEDIDELKVGFLITFMKSKCIKKGSFIYERKM